MTTARTAFPLVALCVAGDTTGGATGAAAAGGVSIDGQVSATAARQSGLEAPSSGVEPLSAVCMTPGGGPWDNAHTRTQTAARELALLGCVCRAPQQVKTPPLVASRYVVLDRCLGLLGLGMRHLQRRRRLSWHSTLAATLPLMPLVVARLYLRILDISLGDLDISSVSRSTTSKFIRI